MGKGPNLPRNEEHPAMQLQGQTMSHLPHEGSQSRRSAGLGSMVPGLDVRFGRSYPSYAQFCKEKKYKIQDITGMRAFRGVCFRLANHVSLLLTRTFLRSSNLRGSIYLIIFTHISWIVKPFSRYFPNSSTIDFLVPLSPRNQSFSSFPSPSLYRNPQRTRHPAPSTQHSGNKNKK